MMFIKLNFEAMISGVLLSILSGMLMSFPLSMK